MATIGRRRAVVTSERMHLSGFVAWTAWLLVHIWHLIGFKNRLVVMFTWAWSYFTYRRGARLILSDSVADRPATPARAGTARLPSDPTTLEQRAIARAR